jgi:hypothetical protein
VVAYRETAYRPLGDPCVLVEFGDETSLPLNFRVVAFDSAIKRSGISGLIETVPVIRSLAVVYNSRMVSRDKMIAALRRVESEMEELTELPPDLSNGPSGTTTRLHASVRRLIGTVGHMIMGVVVQVT